MINRNGMFIALFIMHDQDYPRGMAPCVVAGNGRRTAQLGRAGA